MRFKSSRAEAEILLRASRDRVKILIDSLRPEAETPASIRSDVTIEPLRGGVLIRISSDDSVGLRAAVNSYLRWAQGVIDVLEKLQPH
jgi:tRNA threonylcarbamoyladenosine modification (KEOPS) complex  Pcc1 subunit